MPQRARPWTTRAILALLLVAWGWGCAKSHPPSPPEVVLDLPFDFTQGCTSHDEAGCERCCVATVNHLGESDCSEVSSGRTASLGSTCPVDCRPCAVCTASQSASALQHAEQARQDCDCEQVDSGGDACFAPDSCACHCRTMAADLRSCPQHIEDVCLAGNRCGALLLLAPGPYAMGSTVTPIWINPSDRPIYLPGCASLVLVGPEGEAVDRSEAPSCSGDGPTRKVMPFETLAVDGLSLGAADAGMYWLRGNYFRDCDDSQPANEADCAAGPFHTQSPVLYVSRAPAEGAPSP